MSSPVSIEEAPTTGIGKLLSENRFFVPTHQRDYTWERDEIDKFFDDLTGALGRGDPLYFVGLMVFMRDMDGRLRVLDGQQRLATTIITFASIRDWLGTNDPSSSQLQYDFIGRTEYGEKEASPRLKLNLNNDDIFQAYVINGKPIEQARSLISKTGKNDPNFDLLDSIIRVHERIANIAADKGEEAKAYFSKLIKFLRDSVIVVRLTVPNESNAFKVFETLNDRGMDLSAIDLVKNYLFGIVYSPNNIELLRQMEHRWSQLSDTLKDDKPDDFLRTYWTSRHGITYTDDIFDGFKAIYKSVADAEGASQDLLEAAEHFAALKSSSDVVWKPYSDRCRSLIDDLNFLGTKLVRPVILAAVKRFDPREFEKLVWLLLVIVVRWQIVARGRPGVIEKSCARLAQSIWKRETVNTAAALKILEEPYGADAAFQATFAAYENVVNSKTVYLLRKIEERERLNKKGQSAKELSPETKLTLEHILPRNPSADWGDVLALDKTLLAECGEKIGNLCLVTEGRNKDLATQSFDKKRPHFADSDILTTSSLGDVEPPWNRKAIEHRQAYLAKLAAQIWKVGPR